MEKFRMRTWLYLSVAFAIGETALAQTPSPNEKNAFLLDSWNRGR